MEKLYSRFLKHTCNIQTPFWCYSKSLSVCCASSNAVRERVGKNILRGLQMAVSCRLKPKKNVWQRKINFVLHFVKRLWLRAEEVYSILGTSFLELSEIPWNIFAGIHMADYTADLMNSMRETSDSEKNVFPCLAVYQNITFILSVRSNF